MSRAVVAKPRRAGVKPSNHVAAIHVLKSKLRLSDDDYRALLHQLTGQTSSKDCTAVQQLKARSHLQLLAEKMGLAQPAQSGKRTPPASPRERKVWALWLDMHGCGIVRDKSSRALNSFVARQTGVSALRFCTAAQQDAVIEALKSWQVRGVQGSA